MLFYFFYPLKRFFYFILNFGLILGLCTIGIAHLSSLFDEDIMTHALIFIHVFLLIKVTNFFILLSSKCCWMCPFFSTGQIFLVLWFQILLDYSEMIHYIKCTFYLGKIWWFLLSRFNRKQSFITNKGTTGIMLRTALQMPLKWWNIVVIVFLMQFECLMRHRFRCHGFGPVFYRNPDYGLLLLQFWVGPFTE